MGGKGSGGRRPGAGRKPKAAHLRALDGGANKRAPKILPTTNRTASSADAIDEFHAPDSLTREQRDVWMSLAPHAFANRTLTRATAYGFELLCRNIVLEQDLARDVELRGGPNHRGLIQRIDAELLRFNLAPCGKPMAEPASEPAKPTSPLDRFIRRAK